MTITIKIKDGQTFEADESLTLLESLLHAGEFIDNPCNGKGKCGKCKVRVLEGECTDLTDEEKRLLKKEEIEDGVRLSCVVFPKGDVTVELMQKVLEHKVLTTGKIPEF